MLYGQVNRQTLYVGGQAVRQVVTYSERVRIEEADEAMVAFQRLLAQFERGEVTNPGVQVETYPDSGKVKQMVTHWSVMK